MSDFDCELEDFEAQLAAMSNDIDAQFSVALSNKSSFDDATFNQPSEQQQKQNVDFDEFEGHVNNAFPTEHSSLNTIDDVNVHDNDNNNEDHIALGLTDLEFTDNEDLIEGRSLVNNHGQHNGVPIHQLTNNTKTEGEDATKAKAAASAPKSCKSKKCCEPEVDPELLALEAEQEAQRQAREAELEEEFKQYQQDSSLTGYVFKQDLAGLKKALSSGQHHPEELDFRGEHTALHHAVFHDEPDFAHALLKAGAHVNVRNFRGETPLMLAAKLEKTGLQMMTLLIEQYGADIHAKDYVGLHAFHHAAEKGMIWNMSLLHTVYGIDVNVVDIYNKNALHWSSWAGHTRCVEWLLRRGCSPYVQDTQGCYPLHWAAAKCRDDVVKLLFRFDSTNGKSTSLRTVAEKTYMKQIRKMLYGTRFDYAQSEFVNDHMSARCDPNIAREKQRRARVDRNTIQQYTPDMTYHKLQNAKHNPVDDIITLPPQEYPNYKSFYEQLKTQNKDGLDVFAFTKKKNENAKGYGRLEFNSTMSVLERLERASWYAAIASWRDFGNLIDRMGFLPILFITLYLIAIYLTKFVYEPILLVRYADSPLAWAPTIFYILWAIVVYNWWRIVMTKPAKLDFFTPATATSSTGLDDGSTLLAPPPKLDVKIKKNVPQLNATDGGDVETGDATITDVEENFTTRKSTSNNNDSNSNNTSGSTNHNTWDSGQGPAGLLKLDIVSPANHEIPTQKYNVQEYQNIATLYTRFVELMTSAKANESNCCYTCEIARPHRSKHCGKCQQCVPRFDHHCPFFNQDIAYSNYHNFLWFLIAVPIHWVVFMAQHWTLFSAGLLNITALPLWWVSFIKNTFGLGNGMILLGFNLFVAHYVMYVIFDVMLFSQHIYLLTEALTTNELMNRDRYSYLQLDQVKWNPFSRGSFIWNFLAGLALYKHREPLCLSDTQCRDLGFIKSPLDVAEKWAQKVKSKFTKSKKQRQQLQNADDSDNDIIV